MRGTSHFDAKVASVLSLSCVVPRAILRARATARSSPESASTTASWTTVPASVSRTERLLRMNSSTPNWSSNSFTWWLMAAGVSPSSPAAWVKFSRRPAASRAFNARVPGMCRAMRSSNPDN